MNYNKENEKQYYNNKLIKETLKDEIKEHHRFDWKEAVLLFIGLLMVYYMRIMALLLKHFAAYKLNNFVKSLENIQV